MDGKIVNYFLNNRATPQDRPVDNLHPFTLRAQNHTHEAEQLSSF
jgi:hypothetical protein